MHKTQKTLSDLVIFNKYAKHIEEKNRRENWDEIVDRYIKMMLKKYPEVDEEIVDNSQYLYDKKVLMSMRAAQFSGIAMERNHSRGYNCAFMPVDSYKSFSEAMFLLLGGTGLGYSVQFSHVDKLPEIKKPTKSQKFVIMDSIEGWAEAVNHLIKSYFGMRETKPRFDYSSIREKGEKLKTAGGKAPGHVPLKRCLQEIEIELELKDNGSKLKPIEVHSIMCRIADAVLSGGIRRAALISLFSADDIEMMEAKSGNWWELNPHFGRANNSAVLLRHRITEDFFMSLWARTEASNSGEPAIIFSNDRDYGYNPCFSGDSLLLTENGYERFDHLDGTGLKIINKDGVAHNGGVYKSGNKDIFEIGFGENETIKCTKDHIFLVDGNPVLAKNLIGEELTSYHFSVNPSVNYIKSLGKEDVYDFFIDDDEHWGVVNGVIAHNCAEISLRPYSFCNLTEINAGDLRSQGEFNERARVAAFFGTLQAGFTDFHYLRPIWQKTTEKDSLVGVGITGICNGLILKLEPSIAAKIAIEENKRVSKIIGIPTAARVTTIKPSGTTSLVLGVSSGIHAWHSKYYIRNIQCAVGDDLYNYFVVKHPKLIKIMDLDSTSAVIGIPQKAPSNAILREDENATKMLERVKWFYDEWVKNGHISGGNTNNVSATVYIKDDEWGDVGDWMWKNRNSFNGLSCLPYDGGSYKDAPFQECTRREYEEKMEYVDGIDLSKIIEDDDNTTLADELACMGGSCEVN